MNNNDIFYQKDYEFFKSLIVNNNHFRYSRFNDGELIASSCEYTNKHNCDKHEYFFDMGVELKNILLNYKVNKTYFLETLYHWYDTSPLIKSLVDEYKKKNKNLLLLDDDFIRFIHENEPDKYIEFLNILFSKKICIVGPYYLKKLNNFFSFDFIEVPIHNCYLNKNEIVKKIVEYKINNPVDVIYLFSTSMLANILVDYFSDNNNTYIDFGSVWDTFFVSLEYSFIRKRSSSNKNEIINNYKNYLI